jgi:hypothetical protein
MKQVKKKYTKPKAKKLKIDKDISLVMMTTPPNNPPW